MIVGQKRRRNVTLNRAALALPIVLLLVVAVSACDARNGAPTTTAPSPSPVSAVTTFSLSGQVVDGTTGSGIAGAAVRIADGPNVGRLASTDAAGTYSLTGLQRSGFTVVVSAANYVSQATGVTLTSDQTLSFRLMPPPTPTFVLTGRVTDSATAAPVAGAIVSINGRYTSTTDTAGRYSVAGFLDFGNSSFTYVSANNYESDYRFIRGTTQNVRLNRVVRITAGDSIPVTIAPGDTLCVNNSQDEPGSGPDYVCRSVRVVAPRDGVVRVEAVSTDGAARPPLELEIVGANTCCSLENPRAVWVAAGTELIASVEMPFGSNASQSFILNTSMSVK
jgi:Carboxypeptidase regulatory-like domain